MENNKPEQFYKIPMELNVVGDKKFIDFWDVINGKDVCCEIVGDKLITQGGGPSKEITLQEFTDKIIEQVKNW